MANIVRQKFPVNEDSPAVYLAHVTGASGADINRATFNTGSPTGTIKRYVKDTVTKALTADGTGAHVLTVTDVVFDTLQGAGSVQWPYSTGYNFRDVIPASAFPEGGRTYVVQYKFTPANNGESFLSDPIEAPSIKNALS